MSFSCKTRTAPCFRQYDIAISSTNFMRTERRRRAEGTDMVVDGRDAIAPEEGLPLSGRGGRAAHGVETAAASASSGADHRGGGDYRNGRRPGAHRRPVRLLFPAE
jgi:hypothetical protein